MFDEGAGLGRKAGCQRGPCRRWAIRIDCNPGAHQRIVWHHFDQYAVALFELGELLPFAVQHIDRNRPIGAQAELAGAALHRFFFQQAERCKCGTCRREHKARAVAHRADVGRGFQHTGAQPLPAHFQQAEGGNAADLDAGAILPQRILQGALDPAIVAVVVHVDEIDDNEPCHVAKAELAGDFLGRLDVGLEGGFLDIIFARRAAGVHIDGNKCLGGVDHDIAARAKLNDRVHHRGELAFHAGAVKQGHRIGIKLHFAGMARHQRLHEGAGLLVPGLAIDIDFVDFAGIDVADRPLDEIAVFIDQRRRAGVQGGFADFVPQPGEIIEIALDFGAGTLEAGGADDCAHGDWQRQIFHDRLQPLAIRGIGNFAADAAALRRVRHQHGIASGERDIGGERCALVAALFLHHLHQHHLATADDFLNLVTAAERHAAAAERFAAVVFGATMLFRTRPWLGVATGFGLVA